MANSDLIGKNFKVDNDNLKKYLGDNISYENMKKIKSELENAKLTKNIASFNNKGGDNTLNWLNNNLKKERDTIYNEKKIRMDTGEENQFKNTHTKDRDNADPTRVRLPIHTKGSVNKQIMSNKIRYESFEKEIENIKYLMEYIDNNKIIK